MRRFRPLRGVRVVSFEAAFSLPSGTRTLAQLGAEVVRVGRPQARADTGYGAAVDGVSRDKASVAVDFQHEQGRELALRLALEADVVCNNFRPPVLRRYGLGAATLLERKPALIVLQLSGYGSGGTWEGIGAFGPGVECFAGLAALSGAEGEPPVLAGSGVFTDQVGGRYAAFAVLAALEERRRTGRGRFIDLSMAEGVSHLLGDMLLAAAVTEVEPRRTGNRDPQYAPQGVYPSLGAGFPRSTAQGKPSETSPGGPWGAAQGRPSETSHDNWVAISVLDDAQWHALRELVDDPRLHDSALDSLSGRQARHDEIDEAIAAWTCTRTKDEAAALLQAHGVPAGPVQKTSDQPFDPQLAARGSFQMVRHAAPVLGYSAHPDLTLAWRIAGATRPEPDDVHPPGADNLRILRRWLHLTAAQVRDLEAAGALAPCRPSAVVEPERTGVRGAPLDPAFAQRLNLPG